MIGIYKITNKQNNKVYIGQSIHCGKRFDEHCKGKQYIDDIISKEGIENFSFEILKELDNRSQLSYWEDYYINLYNSLYPNGYNLRLNTKEQFQIEKNKSEEVTNTFQKKEFCIDLKKIKRLYEQPFFNARILLYILFKEDDIYIQDIIFAFKGVDKEEFIIRNLQFFQNLEIIKIEKEKISIIKDNFSIKLFIKEIEKFVRCKKDLSNILLLGLVLNSVGNRISVKDCCKYLPKIRADAKRNSRAYKERLIEANALFPFILTF